MKDSRTDTWRQSGRRSTFFYQYPFFFYLNETPTKINKTLLSTKQKRCLISKREGFYLHIVCFFGKLFQLTKEVEMASSIPPIPDEYLCPITRDIMSNPVILIEDVNLMCLYEFCGLHITAYFRVVPMKNLLYKLGYRIIIHLQ
jgi:hypothetical protein